MGECYKHSPCEVKCIDDLTGYMNNNMRIEALNHLQAIAMIYTEPLKNSSIPTLKGRFALKLYDWFTLYKFCSC